MSDDPIKDRHSDNLMKIIDKYMDDAIQGKKIKNRLKELSIPASKLTHDKLIQILKDVDLYNQIMKEIEELETQNYQKIKDSDNENQNIILKINKGKSFVDFVNESSRRHKYFQILVQFLGSRQKSRLIEVCDEFNFDEGYKLNLVGGSGISQKNTTEQDLLKLNQQIHIVMVLYNKQQSSQLVYSIKQIEWRHLLVYGKIQMNLEMVEYRGNSCYSGNSVGILQIQMDLDPRPAQLLKENLLNDQIQNESKLNEAIVIDFYDYCQDWWSDYKQIGIEYQSRIVKIFNEDEDGVQRSVCQYVIPLKGFRGIDTPMHAARFVSLIPYKVRERPGGDRLCIFKRHHTFLSEGSGDIEDHVSLLCSLLLGFGLNAYVVGGLSTDGPHFWVLTIQNNQYKYWESLTGDCFEQTDPRSKQIYRKVGCVFNHEQFYANIQQNDNSQCSLNINDNRSWKRLEINHIQKIANYQNSRLQFIKSGSNSFVIENHLEKVLKQKMTQYRAQHQLKTKFDNVLEQCLQIALFNYEMQKLNNDRKLQENEFQKIIKSLVPSNHSFKAFPIQFSHTNGETIWGTILQSQIGQDIVDTKGDQTHLGIRVKVVDFVDEIRAVWVIMASRFFKI